MDCPVRAVRFTGCESVGRLRARGSDPRAQPRDGHRRRKPERGLVAGAKPYLLGLSGFSSGLGATGRHRRGEARGSSLSRASWPAGGNQQVDREPQRAAGQLVFRQRLLERFGQRRAFQRSRSREKPEQKPCFVVMAIPGKSCSQDPDDPLEPTGCLLARNWGWCKTPLADPPRRSGGPAIDPIPSGPASSPRPAS